MAAAEVPDAYPRALPLFNWIMSARSLCYRSSAGQMRTYLRVAQGRVYRASTGQVWPFLRCCFQSCGKSILL